MTLVNGTDRTEVVRLVIWEREREGVPGRTLYDGKVTLEPQTELDPQRLADVPLGYLTEICAEVVAYPGVSACLYYRQTNHLACSVAVVLGRTGRSPPALAISCR